jgi:beta-glucanase (GH16 family)
VISPQFKRLCALTVLGAGAFGTLAVAPVISGDTSIQAAQAAESWTSTTFSGTPKKTLSKAFTVANTQATAAANISTASLVKGQLSYNRIILRQSGNTFYTAEMSQGNGVSSQLQIQRVVGGKITVLATKNLGVLSPTTARRFALEVTTVDGNPVLKAAQWAPGSARPAWQLSATDTSAAKILTGTAGSVSSYISGTGTAKVTSAWTSLEVTPVSNGSASLPSASVPGWGEPSFRDEFTSNTLGTTWAVRDKLNLSYDLAQVRKENVSVSGGVATLSTQRLATPIEAAGRTRTYSSAYIDSIKTQSQAYGRWEIRAKLPAAAAGNKGIWPAFWLRPDDGKDGEIDIFEYYGTPTDKSWQPGHRTEGTVHFDSTNKTGKYKVSAWTPAATALDDGKFHTWVMEWTPEAITFYVDGTKYYTVSASSDSRYKAVYGSGRKYNMRLNVQVGSDYWGGPNNTQTAAHTDFVVDYVRVWKYAG